MNLENTLIERSQIQNAKHIVSLYCYKMLAVDKSMETESALVVCGDQDGKTGRGSFIDTGFFLRCDENILN